MASEREYCQCGNPSGEVHTTAPPKCADCKAYVDDGVLYGIDRLNEEEE